MPAPALLLMHLIYVLPLHLWWQWYLHLATQSLPKEQGCPQQLALSTMSYNMRGVMILL